MKIRIIKKLAKSKRIKTDSLRIWFVKSVAHNKSIRNIVIRGMLKNGNESAAMRLILKFEVMPKFNGKWELIE